MAKINIHTILKTQEDIYEYFLPAIFKEEFQIIIYKEKDEQKTTTTYNYKTKELSRENNSLSMHYIFDENKKTNGTIFVKELNKKLDVVIETRKILRCKNNIEIDFLVEDQQFNYKIEVK